MQAVFCSCWKRAAPSAGDRTRRSRPSAAAASQCSSTTGWTSSCACTSTRYAWSATSSASCGCSCRPLLASARSLGSTSRSARLAASWAVSWALGPFSCQGLSEDSDKSLYIANSNNHIQLLNNVSHWTICMIEPGEMCETSILRHFWTPFPFPVSQFTLGYSIEVIMVLLISNWFLSLSI